MVQCDEVYSDSQSHASRVCRTTQRHYGALYVKLIEGKDLKKTDVFGTSDPFVELWLDGSKIVQSDVSLVSSFISCTSPSTSQYFFLLLM
jgi:hypothetical protein